MDQSKWDFVKCVIREEIHLSLQGFYLEAVEEARTLMDDQVLAGVNQVWSNLLDGVRRRKPTYIDVCNLLIKNGYTVICVPKSKLFRRLAQSQVSWTFVCNVYTATNVVVFASPMYGEKHDVIVYVVE
jgi:hypothetical protein